MQAMDNSHVALSSVELRCEGFDPYRCDRPMSIGISLAALNKIVKTAGNEDILTIKKDDDGDSLGLIFEGSKTDRVAEYDMKLMDIDSEHLGIPDTQYDAVVRMSSGEFARITRDLANVGDTVKIEVTKEGVGFSAEGEIGNAKLTLKQGSGSAAVADDEDDDEDDDKPKSKKRKAGGASGGASGSDEMVPVRIQLQQSVSLTFSLKYLSNFAKAAPLCKEVALHMSNEVPLLVSTEVDRVTSSLLMHCRPVRVCVRQRPRPLLPCAQVERRRRRIDGSGGRRTSLVCPIAV